MTFESIKALDVKTSTLFIIDFVDDNILSCFFFFFLIIGLNFLIFAVITKFFNPIVELVIPIEIPTKEAKAEMETPQVFEEINITKCSILFKTL